EPQCRIRLDRGRQIGWAAVVGRPAAVLALLVADPVRGERGLLARADAEELAHQQVLGVHRDVRLELALPPAFRVLAREQVLDRAVERRARRSRDVGALRAERALGFAPHAASAWGARASESSAARAATVPLRTALSIVAGQPVSVHAPASHTAGCRVAAPGRSRRVPATCRKVAAGSLCTMKSSTCASRAAGNSAANAGRKSPRSSARLRPSHSVAAESDTVSTWPRDAPEAAVRSKIHWSGVSQPAASGRSVTARSNQTCRFTIGDAPSRASADASIPASAGAT